MTTFNKPTVSINVNGNVYAIIAHVRNALQRSNQRERAEEFMEHTQNCKSYDEVIALTFEYVDWESQENDYDYDYNDDNEENIYDDENDSKPILKRSTVDGNAYAIIGAVKQALKNNKDHDKVNEFNEKALQSKSYDDLLQLTFQYVNWR